MGIRNCPYPWHWMIITERGEIMPCGHGSRSVGNLRDQTIDEVWNGPVMQALRAAILADEVHEVCRSTDCPFQQPHLAFTFNEENATLDEQLARTFDDAWYLENHVDVMEAVRRRQLSNGLEHFVRFGRAEGRAYRLTDRSAASPAPLLKNDALALLEYSRGATILRSRPVDIVIQVSTICNLRCVMCPHGADLVDQPRHMPLDLLDRAQPYLDTANRMIVSGFGEPLIAPAFWEVVRRVLGRDDIFIRANSNGVFLTEENSTRLLDSGLSEISFSLDAATAKTYRKIRGADFDKITAAIGRMCEQRSRRPSARLEIFLNMTLMQENVAEAPAFVELAHRLGVDAALFSQLFPFGDDPAWRRPRPDWTFVYSEQMLIRHADVAHTHLTAAKERGDALGMKIIFQSNTHLYLTPTTK